MTTHELNTPYRRLMHMRNPAQDAMDAQVNIALFPSFEPNYLVWLFSLNQGVGHTMMASRADIAEQLTPTTYLIPAEGDFLA